MLRPHTEDKKEVGKMIILKIIIIIMMIIIEQVEYAGIIGILSWRGGGKVTLSWFYDRRFEAGAKYCLVLSELTPLQPRTPRRHQGK